MTSEHQKNARRDETYTLKATRTSSEVKTRRSYEESATFINYKRRVVISWVKSMKNNECFFDDGRAKHVHWQTNQLQDDACNANHGNATSLVVKGLRPHVPYKAAISACVAGSWSRYSPYWSVIKRCAGKAQKRKGQKRSRQKRLRCLHERACQSCHRSLWAFMRL